MYNYESNLLFVSLDRHTMISLTPVGAVGATSDRAFHFCRVY